jgi:HEAT repeat protein
VQVAAADPEFDARADARSALDGLCPLSVPVLVGLLRDADPRRRCEAIRALERCGPVANAVAIPALEAALDDEDAWVREAAAWTLWRGHGHTDRPLVTIFGLLKEDDGELRREAAHDIYKISEETPEAFLPWIDALIAALDNEWLRVRDCAAFALGRIGPDAEQAVSALIRVVCCENPETRQAAAKALGGIGPGARAAVPALLDLLRSKQDSEAAMEGLGGIGPDSHAAVPLLLEYLDHEYFGIRRSAVTCLGRIGPGAGAAVPRLIEALQDRAVCEAAAEALRRIDPDAAAGVGVPCRNPDCPAALPTADSPPP